MSNKEQQNKTKGLVSLSEDDIEDDIPQKINRQSLKRLLKYLKPYQNQVIWTIFLSIVAIVAALIMPYLIKIGIDQYIKNRNLHGLTKIALIYSGATVVQYFALYYQGMNMTRIGQGAIYDLRESLFKHIQLLDVNFFDNQKAGRIMIRVTNDVNTLEELLSSGVITAFADSFTVFGLMAMMLWIDWKMSLIIFLTLPAIIWVAVFLRGKVLASVRKIRSRLSIVNANLNESLMGIRVTQAFTREPINLKLFKQINEDHYQATMGFIPLNAFFWPWIGFLNIIGTSAVLMTGGFLQLQGLTSVGSIAAFMNYINRFFQPIQNLSNLFNVISTAMASCERIFELMDLEPQVADPEFPKEIPDIKGNVIFENVSFGYKQDEMVLSGFNLNVKAGEIIALVGPTGAGKSTIINLLGRFYDPLQGRILLEGIDLRDFSQQEYRKNIAMVLQDSFIFSGTIAENIRYGKPEASDAEVVNAARVVGIHPYISSLSEGYQTKVQERGSGLSVGQRQLIAFARAIIREPKILILDEATSSIDSQTEMLLQTALNSLITGRTAFVIAHRLSTIRKADRIIVIEDGKIAESGNHQDLMAREGLYYKLYSIQYQAG